MIVYNDKKGFPLTDIYCGAETWEQALEKLIPWSKAFIKERLDVDVEPTDVEVRQREWTATSFQALIAGNSIQRSISLNYRTIPDMLGRKIPAMTFMLVGVSLGK